MRARDFLILAESFDAEPFREGLCYALAIKLDQRTGWPLVVIAGDDENEPIGFYTIHAFNLLPDGRAVDIDGPRAIDELFRSCVGEQEEGWSIREIDQADLLAMLSRKPSFADYGAAYGAIEYLRRTWPQMF